MLEGGVEHVLEALVVVEGSVDDPASRTGNRLHADRGLSQGFTQVAKVFMKETVGGEMPAANVRDRDIENQKPARRIKITWHACVLLHAKQAC